MIEPVEYLVATVTGERGTEHVVLLVHDRTPDWWNKVASFPDRARAEAYVDIQNMPPEVDRPREAPAPIDKLPPAPRPGWGGARPHAGRKPENPASMTERVREAITECLERREATTIRNLADRAHMSKDRVRLALAWLERAGQVDRDTFGKITEVKRPPPEFSIPPLASAFLRAQGRAVEQVGPTLYRVDGVERSTVELLDLANTVRDLAAATLPEPPLGAAD